MARLRQVIIKLNIGLARAVEFLNSKGGNFDDDNPNAKLTSEQEQMLLREFGTDEMIKQESDRLMQERIEKEREKEEVKQDKAEEPKPVEEIVISVELPHLKPVATIDLDAVGKPPVKTEEKPVAPVETPKPAPQPEQEKPVEAPAEPRREAQPDEVFTYRKVEFENNLKMVGKIDLNAINDATRPTKKSKDAKRKDRVEKPTAKATAPSAPAKKEEIFRTDIPQLDGPHTVGKIALTDESGSRKKRKRIGKNERVDINKVSGGVRDKKNKRSIHVANVSEEDVALQIKETLARLTENKRSNKKAADYRKNKREAVAQRQQEQAAAERRAEGILKLTEFVTANDLATMMNVPVTQVIQTCFNLGLFVSINQRLDAETINIVADEFGFKTEFVSADVAHAIEEDADRPEDLEPRSPIVTVMGHVDHGKTSLLDYIRKSNVIAGEAGGITQHIGAYNVKLDDGRHITFLDTPGHEAFTAMRARGAKVTDIAIIIVAADDGVMPQTVEAINHASAAGVPIVFAINKVDKPNANPDKIKEELANMNYMVEEWGGKYQSQDISAKKGLGVKELLEKVLLEADLLDLKANPNRKASGSVIESTLDKGRGYVATVLVSNGTLHVGDVVLAGTAYGRIKAMFNERNQRIKEAKPSEPVIILGLNGAPQAGDNFNVFDQDHEARDIAARREQLAREQSLRTSKHLTLEELGRRRALGDFHELNVIVKGDVDGSIEALSDSLIKLSTPEVQVNVIHKAVGQISESDVMLAAASNAIIIGFQVRPSADARKTAEREEVDIRLYSIIYDAIEELKAAMEGLLSPEIKEEITATLEIRETFKISKVGTVAGCMVKEGKIARSNKVRLIRDGIVVYTGDLASLKRMKDDVKEVASGFECGLNIANYNDIKVGDIIEGFVEVEVKKTL
ncbi:MAG: translation initiation factor IF-2 [Bacteroidales bacterium]|nr:translation initiation factor IF-2 [Bacteroidales bacterium]MDY6037308.1 translation initiation factor IF-2 [Paludibacteraceae bacterium]